MNLDVTDLVVVIAGNINNVEKQYNFLDLKSKNIPIYVITSELNTENVVNCINITKYVSYIRREEMFLTRIINILRVHYGV